MKKLFFLILFGTLGLLFFQNCNDTVTSLQETQNFSGTVFDEVNIPIPNAIVTAVRINQGKTTTLINEEIVASDTTDEDGNFDLENLPAPLGSIKIKIVHQDFLPYEEPLLSLMGKTEKNKIRAQIKHRNDCCGKIFIYAFASDSSRLDNVEVRLNREQKLIRKSHTDNDGRVVFEHICAGNYWIRIAKEGFQTIEQEFTLNNCDTLQFYYYLQHRQVDSCCNGLLKVEVKDKANGNFLNGAILKLKKNGTLLNTLIIKENQPILFRELCPGNYSLLVIHNGFKALEHSFTLGCNDTLEYTAELEEDTCCNGWVKVIVKNQSNEPISQAKVTIWKSGKSLGYHYTNNDGVVTFNELCNGTYAFEIQRDGYKHIEFQVEIGCGEGKEITQILERHEMDSCCNGLIVIRVKDINTHQPLNGSKVKLWRNNTLKQVETVHEGVTVFRNLCAGIYGISILNENYKALEFTLNLECNDTLDITKFLEPKFQNDSCCKGKIIFIIRDSISNEFVGGVNVYLWKGNQKIAASQTKEDNGKAIFEHICQGEYSFSLFKRNYFEKEGVFRIKCNDTVEIPVQILRKESSDTCCTAKLKLKVIDDSTGSAIQNARVEIRINAHNDQTIYDQRTNIEGWVIKENLCAPQTYSIRISFEGYITREFQVYFNECKTIQETVRLSRR
ncbi:MAG: carboxypeptidase regulatory-like domain-containing protein [Candidatus Kapaibacteriales bacterium]